MINEIGRLEYLIKNTSIGVPYLIETWQAAAIDATVWTTVLTVGGTVTRSVAEEPYQKVILAGAAAGDAARLHTIHEWQLAPDTWGANTFNKLLIMEWEAFIDHITEIDNATFWMGLTAGNLDTAASNHIAGFCLVGDALQTRTNDATGPTTKAVAGPPTLDQWRKYGIVAYNGIIEFYLNEALVNRHITVPDAEDLPDVNAHGQFYLLQEAAGAGTGELHVATISIRPGVIL